MDIEWRFFTRVDMTPGFGPKGDCWRWAGASSVRGYGHIRYMGRPRRAHRIAYLLEYGVDALALQVCHRCDNPPCVRPDHLFLGTAKDNAIDAEKKGRQVHKYGETSPNAKLSNFRAEMVRELYSSGIFKQSELAESFGVSQFVVSKIVRNEGYRMAVSV